MIDRAPNANVTPSGDDVVRKAVPVMAAARRFVAFMMVGIGIGLLVMLVVMRQANYDPTPSLSPEQFHAAHEHWKAPKIPS